MRTVVLGLACVAGAFAFAPAVVPMRGAPARHGARALRAAAASSAPATSATDNDFKDWKATNTVFFPGQGAQYVGMAGQLVKDVPKAKQMFEQASEVLGYDLLKMCLEGPKDKLDSTVISQPAIYVASLAAVEKARMELGQEAIDKITVAAGLSLGEYTALCFAGAISFEDGVKIVKVRGEAMQRASEKTPSGMVSVIGLDSEIVQKLCEKAAADSGAKIQIANYLCAGNYAISGAKSACAKAAEIAKPEFKARMTVPLSVAGAFHTDFMAPAVEELADVLGKVKIVKPRIPVISNVDAKPHSDPAVIKAILTKQVTSPVLWENTIAAMMERGYEQGWEMGPGKVVAGIVKRINKDAKLTNVEA
jgi:[acyl-carrier-protein] S-malonyltransferase